MNRVWSIILAEKHPFPSIKLYFVAPDEESARAGIREWFPGREIVSVLPYPIADKPASEIDVGTRCSLPVIRS